MVKAPLEFKLHIDYIIILLTLISVKHQSGSHFSTLLSLAIWFSALWNLLNIHGMTFRWSTLKPIQWYALLANWNSMYRPCCAFGLNSIKATHNDIGIMQLFRVYSWPVYGQSERFRASAGRTKRSRTRVRALSGQRGQRGEVATCGKLTLN